MIINIYKSIENKTKNKEKERCKKEKKQRPFSTLLYINIYSK